VPDRPVEPVEPVEAAYGVLNKDTGVAATTDSVFQIGSITKVWTATMVMQLVEEGALHLDAPVVDVLPEFRLADGEVTTRVTMRHLLTHTSGIDGDVFTDTGRGDDCLEKYVVLLGEVAQNHPLGATFSYCNSGYAVAGRVIERLTGLTWDKALRDRLLDPLGLKHTVTLPEEAILHRAAVGHQASAGGQPARVPRWILPRGLGPGGLITASVADVLTFARLHLAGGITQDGRRLLSAASVATMAAKHADLPNSLNSRDSWGLGWSRFGWDGHRLIGHDGGTIGQAAYLRLLPEAGLAVVLLTNGGESQDLYDDLFGEIFAELAGIQMPRPPTPPAEPPTVDVERHVGRYERAGERYEVFVRDGSATLRITPTGPLRDLLNKPVRELTMTPLDGGGDLFAVREPPARAWTPVTFYRLPDGEQYMSMGSRATPKVA
jgi:CubicO group peptidase (beta-lactamase class C family)